MSDTKITGLEQIEDAIAQRSLPPVDEWHPANISRMDLVIKRDGSWWYRGSQIQRHRMVRLFSTVLRRDDDGWCLVTPVEKLLITVEDAPFIATTMSFHGVGETSTVTFTTNVEEQVIVDKEHPIFVTVDEHDNPSPYVIVRRDIPALIARSVYYQLVDHCVEQIGEDGISLGVWSSGLFHSLGSISNTN